MSYDHIFWDWNGTLLDDISISISAINMSLQKRNLPLMDLARYDKIFCFPVVEYYKKLGFNLQKESYDILAKEFIDNYRSLLHTAELHKEAQTTLKRFHKLNVPQYILSASEINILLQGVEKFGIANYFTDIIALKDIYAQGKIEIAKKWFDSNPLQGTKVLIGDMPHDYEVATALDMDCILIASGHSTRKKLEQFNVPIFDNINQVFNHILDIPQIKKTFSYRSGKNEDIKNYDLAEAKSKKSDNFVSSYKNFYNDVKNSTATEDW